MAKPQRCKAVRTLGQKIDGLKLFITELAGFHSQMRHVRKVSGLGKCMPAITEEVRSKRRRLGRE